MELPQEGLFPLSACQTHQALWGVIFWERWCLAFHVSFQCFFFMFGSGIHVPALFCAAGALGRLEGLWAFGGLTC